VDHGGGIPPAALVFLGIFLAAAALAWALKSPPKKK
jgi:hypothetical protein